MRMRELLQCFGVDETLDAGLHRLLCEEIGCGICIGSGTARFLDDEFVVEQGADLFYAFSVAVPGDVRSVSRDVRGTGR